jgi:aspartate racemase
VIRLKTSKIIFDHRMNYNKRRRLGILGGMSWASSAKYYEQINRKVIELTHGAHAADIVLWSFDTVEIESLIHAAHWAEIGARLQKATDGLVECGVDGIMLASNTVHQVFDDELLHVPVHFLHIRDALLSKLASAHVRTVGLVGTSAMLGGDVYRNSSDHSSKIEFLRPPRSMWPRIDNLIFESLCRGLGDPNARDLVSEIGQLFSVAQVDCIVLACTELGMLDWTAMPVPVYDTAQIHAEEAAVWCVRPD